MHMQALRGVYQAWARRVETTYMAAVTEIKPVEDRTDPAQHAALWGTAGDHTELSPMFIACSPEQMQPPSVYSKAPKNQKQTAVIPKLSTKDTVISDLGDALGGDYTAGLLCFTQGSQYQAFEVRLPDDSQPPADDPPDVDSIEHQIDDADREFNADGVAGTTLLAHDVPDMDEQTKQPQVLNLPDREHLTVIEVLYLNWYADFVVSAHLMSHVCNEILFVCN